MATITTMIAQEHVKRTGWSTGTSLSTASAHAAGPEAAHSALHTIDGRRITSGAYLNDTFIHLFQQISGIGRETKPTLVWAAEETVVAPKLAGPRLQVENIAEHMG